MIISGAALVDARVIGPVAVDGNAIALQLAQHRERVPARHREEVHAHPQCREFPPHMRDDGQEALDAKVMVDEEAARCPLLHEHTHIAHRLLVVGHVDHRQHRRAHALEQFPEVLPVHGG